MLNNWLKPLPKSMDEFICLLNDGQIGRQIASFRTDFPNLENCDIAIIGFGEFSHSIRRALYQMECPFGVSIADLGNIASISQNGIQPVLDELQSANIIPIILGGNDELVSTFCSAASSNNDRFHPLFIDEKIAYGKVLQRSYINSITESIDCLKAVSVLGYQKHMSSPESFNKDHSIMLNALRLSQLKSDPRGIEPYIRDCTSISFSLNALKKAEAPNKIGFNPSGLKSEEACQICRYAGINEQMSSFMIHGIDMTTEECTQTATLIGQMVWYFLDGVGNRMSEYPMAPEHLTEYIVTSTSWEEPIHFYKSMITGRWWMAHPHHANEFDKIIPCTYEEYLSACQDEISDRLISLLSQDS